MWAKFLLWFITFGLSFLIESFGWTDQGRAFIYLDWAIVTLIIIIAVLSLLVAGRDTYERFEIPFLLIFNYVFELVVCMLATWGATQLFDVDFFVAYQIMSFGQCLSGNSKKKK